MGAGVQTSAYAFYLRFPQVFTDILLFSLCGSLGQLVILYNIREYGSLVNTIVTVTRCAVHALVVSPALFTPSLCLSRACRKFLTIIVSVVYYNHSMSVTKWAGAVVVFMGLGLEAYHSYQRKHR